MIYRFTIIMFAYWAMKNNVNIHKFDALHCTMYLQQRFLAEVTEDSNETEETKIVKERNEG